MSCNNCKPDWKCNQGRCERNTLQGCAMPGTLQSLDGKTWMPAIAEDRDGTAFNWRQIMPLPGRLTLDEWLQRRMPSDNMGFALALAIVGGIMIGVLLVHAWARM